MKQIKPFVLILVALLCCLSVCAHDFEAKNAEGVTIYYNKLSENTCAVTYCGTNHLKVTDSYRSVDQLIIPSWVFVGDVKYTVTSIGEYAFFYSSFASVTIPNSVTSIKKQAFNSCESLTSITIPNSVTSIEDLAFNNCGSLKKVNIKDIRTWCNIDFAATGNPLREAKNLYLNDILIKDLIIPDGITEIKPFAFHDCESITSVTIPYGVTSIGWDAFCGCSNLSSVTIPNSVVSIGKYAFSECKSLASVNISNKVKTIGEFSFLRCRSLKNVTIPNSVTSINNGAFCGCHSLISVTLPNSVSYMGTNVFYDCPNLKTVTLTNGLTVDKANELYAWKNVNFEVDDSTPMFDPKAFPIINIGDIVFVDDGNRKIDANERCYVKVKVNNSGKGAAFGCVAKVNINGVAGVTARDVNVPTIAPGETTEVEIELLASSGIMDGNVNVSVSIDEPNGFGCDPTLLTVETKAFEAPKVLIADYSVTGASGGTLSKRVPFDLQILLQNAAQGSADDVDVTISVPQNVFLMEGEQKTYYAKLSGGETKSMVYSLIVNNNYSATTIPVQFSLREKHGKYAENKTINLALNQSFAQNKIEIKGEDNKPQGNIAIAKIQGSTKQAETDVDIPNGEAVNDKTFAIVIGNENYQRVAAVEFANNDARVFAKYCEKTLGVPASNIHLVENATLNDMKYHFNWLRQIVERYNGEAKVVVYYAGHGIPDENTQTAYLLPVDGYGTDVTTGYSLAELYRMLGSLPSTSKTVFLDACFSGALRGDGMLATARGVAIKVKSAAPQSNMVVFSAAQGDETAYPFKEKGHGMFTYFLLKKLQETKGAATLGELRDYIIDSVGKQSIIINGKAQTPSVSPSVTVGESWKDWRLS